MEKVLFDFAQGLMYVLTAVFALGLLGLFISLFVAMLSLVIWPVRARLRRVAKVTLATAAVLLAVGLLFVLFGIFNAAALLVAVGAMVAFAWLFFRVVPDDVGAEPRVHGTWGKFRERFIDFTSMERPLWLLTALAIAQLIASAVLLVAYALPPQPRGLEVALYEGQPVSIERFVFWTALAFLIAAWSLVLVGASPGGMTRALILLGFTLAIFPIRLRSQPLFVFMWLGAAVTVWSWAILTWRRRGTPPRLIALSRWRPTIVSLLFLAGVLAAYYCLLLLFAPSAGPYSFPKTMTDQIFNFALLLVPILFLTGRDCAELAELGAHFALARIPRRHSRRILPIVTLLVAGGALAWSMKTLGVPAFSYRDVANYFSPQRGLLIYVAPGVAILAILAYCLYRFARRRSPVVRFVLFSLVTVLALIVAVSGTILIFAFSTYSLAIGVLGVAALLALRLLIKRSAFQEWRSAHVPFVAVLLTALFLTGGHELVTLWQAAYGLLPPHAVDTEFAGTECATEGIGLGGSTSVVCSFAYPAGWRRLFSPKYRTIVYEDHQPSDARPMFLLTVRDASELRGLSSDPTATDLASAIWPFLPTGGISTTWNVDLKFGKQPAWAAAEFMTYRNGARQHVWIWARRINGLVWLLGATAPERHRAYYEDIFGRVVGSWRPDRTPPEPTKVIYPDLKSTALRLSSFGLLPVVLGPLGLLIMFLPRASLPTTRPLKWIRAVFSSPSGSGSASIPQPGGPREVAGLFIVIVAIAAFFFLPHGDLTEALGHREALSIPGNVEGHPAADPVPAAQAVTAFHFFVAGATVVLATVFLVREMAPRHAYLLVELLQLNIALLFLSVFVGIYSGVSRWSEQSVAAQAALLIVLKLWDLLVSGKDVTNINGRVFERRFLVLLYLGYLMLVSTAILYFSSQRLPDPHQPMERFFDAEILVRQGIVWLGIPLLVLGFLFRIRRLFARALGGYSTGFDPDV